MQTSKKLEIDIVEILLESWQRRKLILKISFIFFILGVFVAIFTRNEYKSEITILFESSNNSLSGVSGLLKKYGGLAGAGINISNNQEDEGFISPQLYPKLILSTPFLLNILNDTIEIGNYKTSLYKYLDKYNSSAILSKIKQYTIGLPQFLFTDELVDTLPQKPPYKLTKKQLGLLKDFKGRIKIMTDEETSLTLTVSVMMPDPLVSEKIANQILNNLTDYLIEYKTEKAKQYLNFISDRLVEAKTHFSIAQNNLAKFRDKNKNVISMEFKTEEENLQAEYNLAFDIYSTLAQQLEQAKIEVQKNMPIFKVISPANIPTVKEKPHRILIVIGFTCFGFIVGFMIIFFKSVLMKYKSEYFAPN